MLARDPVHLEISAVAPQLSGRIVQHARDANYLGTGHKVKARAVATEGSEEEEEVCGKPEPYS